LKKNFYILPLLILLFFSAGFKQKAPNFSPSLKELEKENHWVDSIFNRMSEDERLGQLMWIRAHSNLGPDHVAKVEKLIKEFQVGGLTFFQGTPEVQAELTNRYQKLSKRVPLIISMDAEWGLGMRLKESAISFPRQLMLGAIQDNRLIYEMGREVARQCRRIGVRFNFAPVADVNNNPNNPVINTRSFGEDRYNVAAKSYQYMMGLQDEGVLACAKHFPGHGDTDVDSHLDLPVILHSMERLDSIELFPFKVLIEQGVGSIMVAHLDVPAIDSTPNFPTTLSRKAVTDLLKNKLGFEGLVVTDALEMKGVAKYYKSGEVEAKALLAGNDALLLPKDLGDAFKAIKEYLRSGKLDSVQVAESVKKNLRTKYRLGLTHFEPIKLEHIPKDLNNNKAKALKRELIENALTLVRNKDDFLPLQRIDTLEIASLAIGAEAATTFQQTLNYYKKIPLFTSGKKITSSKSRKLIRQLENKETVVVSLHDMSSYASQDFGLTKSLKDFIEKLRQKTKVILVVFGNPYALKYFDKEDWLLEAYEENEMTEDIAAQALFGAFSIRGRLPVTASAKSKFGDGITTNSLLRLGYGLPEQVGLNSDSLSRIDTLFQMMIDTGAAPGGVVLVAKDRKIVFQKAFGYHTYDKKHPTQKDDLFDLASVTKVCATTISVMKLHEEGIINIFDPLSKYLPELDTTNKAKITIKKMMTHHARLRPWIPFYLETITEKGVPLPDFYRKKKSKDFSTPVAENLFLRNDYRDSIFHKIDISELRDTAGYKYSGLFFYLAVEMIQKLTGKPLDEFADEQFYKPLSLQTTTYNPRKKFPKERMVPAEDDDYYRHQRLQGYVHDMGAAMLGGVSGNAGLFSDANDLAILLQMLVNKGYYGGRRFFKPETVRLFTTRCEECTRRGIGFDMLQTDTTLEANMSTKASLSTFGHLGFTGNAVWADPEYNIVFVFLSNRTFPTMQNNKQSELNFRPRIQEAVYNALEY